MIYNTGSLDDWNHISKISEDPAWTWDAMARYRDLSQKYVAPNDGHDDVSQRQVPSLLLLILTLRPRRINTSRLHTAVTGWYLSAFLGTHSPLIQ